MPALPRTSRTTTPMAAGINQPGRSAGSASDGRLDGARFDGAAARGATATAGSEVEAALVACLNSSGTGCGVGVASPVHSELETWLRDGPGVHDPVSTGDHSPVERVLAAAAAAAAAGAMGAAGSPGTAGGS